MLCLVLYSGDNAFRPIWSTAALGNQDQRITAEKKTQTCSWQSSYFNRSWQRKCNCKKRLWYWFNMTEMICTTTCDQWWCIKWKYFARYWLFVRGIHRSPVNYPHKVMRNFDVFFDFRLNKRLGKQWWGWWFEMPSHPLWHHCNENDALNLHFVVPTDKVRWGHNVGQRPYICSSMGTYVHLNGSFQASSQKVLIQFTWNLACVLVWWVFRNDSIFGPVAKYLAPWWAKN